MYDTDVARSHFDSQQLDAIARLVDAVAHCDESVCLTCEPGVSTVALLNRAEAELSGYDLRCVRVHGPATGGLGIRDLIAQVVGRPDPDAVGDGDLKAGFMTLTEPGDGYERVILLVAEAHTLQPSALQYVQLACQSSSKLRVVLAGQPSLAATLADDRFAYLRQRITRTFQPRGPTHDKVPGLFSTVPKQSSVPDGRYGKNGAWLPAGLGAAAALVLLAGVAGWQYLPSLLVLEMRANASAPASEAASSRVEASIPATSAPVAEFDRSGRVALQAEYPPIKAVTLRAAEVLGPPEPASQEHVQAAAKPIEKTSAFGQEPGPPSAVAAEPAPKSIDAAVKQGSASVVLGVSIPEPLGMSAESRATPHDEPPISVASEPTVEPPQDAQPVASLAPALDAAQPPPLPAPAGEPPVLPQPELRMPAATAPSFEALQARHVRRGTDRTVASVAAPPVSPMDERHCRAIVLYVQLGEELSDADKQFLRDDCHAR